MEDNESENLKQKTSSFYLNRTNYDSPRNSYANKTISNLNLRRSTSNKSRNNKIHKSKLKINPKNRKSSTKRKAYNMAYIDAIYNNGVNKRIVMEHKRQEVMKINEEKVISECTFQPKCSSSNKRYFNKMSSFEER